MNGFAERHQVTVFAKAANHAVGDVGQIGMSAEVFPGVHVGQMYLDEGNICGQKSITNGNAGMREGCGVDNNKSDAICTRILNGGNDITFNIRLKCLQFGLVFLGHIGKRLIYRIERIGAVNFGFACAQQI